ncbi:hypothetical protein M758_11G169100 [Ceratodon purpureus]|nr:hypothetical protein M758_11G169100 [Ceratodon purpureus]
MVTMRRRDSLRCRSRPSMLSLPNSHTYPCPWALQLPRLHPLPTWPPLETWRGASQGHSAHTAQQFPALVAPPVFHPRSPLVLHPSCPTVCFVCAGNLHDWADKLHPHAL